MFKNSREPVFGRNLFVGKAVSIIFELKETMKQAILVFLSVVSMSAGYSQSQYAKTYRYAVCQPNWAKVKTTNGLYGFIDRSGEEVVSPIYDKIFRFGEHRENWAMVRSITGLYGFIDNTGKEIVKPVYAKVFPFNEHMENHALVRSVTGLYGFIDTSGKEVVSPVLELEAIRLSYDRK